MSISRTSFSKLPVDHQKFNFRTQKPWEIKSNARFISFRFFHKRPCPIFNIIFIDLLYSNVTRIFTERFALSFETIARCERGATSPLRNRKFCNFLSRFFFVRRRFRKDRHWEMSRCAARGLLSWTRFQRCTLEEKKATQKRSVDFIICK